MGADGASMTTNGDTMSTRAKLLSIAEPTAAILSRRALAELFEECSAGGGATYSADPGSAPDCPAPLAYCGRIGIVDIYTPRSGVIVVGDPNEPARG